MDGPKHICHKKIVMRTMVVFKYLVIIELR